MNTHCDPGWNDSHVDGPFKRNPPSTCEPEMSAAALFRRPDPSMLSPAIPLFFIGRNGDGFWVARNADASSGGLFLLKRSAIRFTRQPQFPFAPAIMMRTRRVELDIPNSGNPFARQLAMLKRELLRVARPLRRFARRLVAPALWPLRAPARLLAQHRIHRAAARLTVRP